MNKRGRYKVYTADNSVEVPKVSLWRKRREVETAERSTTQLSTPTVMEASEELARISKDIDFFHKEAIQSVFPDCSDEPVTLDEPSYQETTENADTEEDDDDDDGCQSAFDDNGVFPNANQPLYSGAKITLAASMILLISYAMRHALSGEALADLLVLIEIHCLSPNLCETNLKTFKKFFQNLKSPLQFHFYCEKCSTYHGLVKRDMCPNCHHPTRKISSSYFLVIPIITQLSSLFADGTLAREISTQKKTHRRKDGEITDVMDGLLYKERFDDDGYFHGSNKDKAELHISLQINTDGVSLFHSSSFSIWPVYFIINELPPHLRFCRTNRIFAGLWFGYSKPDFCTFLKPFAESLHELYRLGVAINNQTIKGILLNGVFDSPARCLFHNMTQFNGFYGCPYCYAPGKSVQTSERGHTLSYPFNMENPNGHHEVRTHASHVKNAEEAQLNKMVLGVKGLTWFSYLPKFDTIRGTAIDYMHCILLGVVKMLATLWFEKSHKQEMFSIASRITEVDQRLLNIKPPSYIPRLPRSLSEISHFKAAELKNFLLFYSLPCLFGILPMDQYHHFSLLVYSTYILLQEKITITDIQRCKRMLVEFVLNITALYGDRYATSNVHLLLHITDRVVDLGPLWASSCFYFEDFNGQLRRLFHGTQYIDSQIAFAVCVHQTLPKMATSLPYGSPEHDFVKKMLEKKTQATKEKVSDKVFVVGAYHHRQLSIEEHHAIFLAFGDIHSLMFFKRLYSNQQIFHCVEYKSTFRRDNSVVRFSGNSYGRVKCFAKLKKLCSPKCDENCCSPLFAALVNVMDNSDAMIEDAHVPRSSSNIHMVALKPNLGQLIAINVLDISDVCVYAKANDNLCFVSVIPNKVERE